ncbi:MAG: hypothetical protein RIQ60_4458 [Pseudomonadota bacterium]|jgi:hypothetical protein
MSRAEPALGDKVDLLASLREVVDYAINAGISVDVSALSALRAADEALERQDKPDLTAIRDALEAMVKLIKPMTLADLHFDNNPLSQKNRTLTGRLQLLLSITALVLLFVIGYLMQALRYDQTFIARVERVQGENPEQKVAALQRMVLFERPLEVAKQPETVRERYLEKVAELQKLTAELVSLSGLAEELAPSHAEASTGLPFDLRRVVDGLRTLLLGASPNLQARPMQVSGNGIPEGFCHAATNGDLELPIEWRKWPAWMQTMAADELRTFCFKLKLQNGLAADLGPIVPQLVHAVLVVKDRIALRSEWYLPFFYGTLGSMLWLMRRVGDIRQSAMGPMPTLMRIALGGMAGIMIGWFSISEPGSHAVATSAIAWPFVLAFVAGYGIEALFSILDRMNAVIADSASLRRGINGAGTPG